MRTRVSDPLPNGKGSFVTGRLIVAALVCSTALFVSAPAHAANVSVTLRVSPVTSASPVELTSCAVSVPESSDGIAVLDAAKASGCIDSYKATSYSFGTFVTCIDGLCAIAEGTDSLADSLVTFWMMSVNKATTSYGVDAYHAKAGDVLEFSYAVSVLCFVPC